MQRCSSQPMQACLRTVCRRLVFAILALTLVAPAALGQSSTSPYTVSPFTALSGWISASPFGINDRGHVVGSLFNWTTGDWDGFYWTPETGMIDLSASTGQSTLWALAVNNHDQVAVAVYGADAVVWSLTGGTVTISGMSMPVAINDAGVVAGSADQGGAVIWSPSGGMVTLYSGTGAAAGINNSGQVVGWYCTSSDNPYYTSVESFFWSKATGFIDIGPGIASNAGRPIAINDKGQVAGWYGWYAGGALNIDMFVWSKATGRKNLHLGIPPYSGSWQPMDSSPIAAVNNAGVVIECWMDSDGITPHSILWSQATGKSDFPLALGSFSVYPQVGINNVGQIYGPTGIPDYGFLAYPFSLQVTPGQIAAGKSATGTVRIPTAGTADVTAKLTSSSTAVTVPSSVVIPAGKKSATFTINSTAAAADHVVTIAAKYNGWQFTQKLTIPPLAKSLALSPNMVVAGGTATGSVTLANKANIDTVVTLASGSPDAIVPTTITVPAGSNSATFPVTTNPTLTSDVSVMFKASCGGATQYASLIIRAEKVAGVAFAPPGVTAGSRTTATVTLNHTTPVDVPLSLSGQSSLASFPASVTVPAGSSSATFQVKGGALTSETQVPIQATSGLNGTFSTGMLTVDPATAFTMSLNPWTVKSGKTGILTVSLTSAAPSGGLTVWLATSDPTTAAFGSSTLTISAGQTTGTATITSSRVTASTTVTISATVGSTSHNIKLTVAP